MTSRAAINDEPIVRNAVRCGICQSPADRYAFGFQCQANPNHVGDLFMGIFSDLTYEPDTPQKNPYSQVCVIKHNGKEVGRIATASQGAAEYINYIASQYGNITVDYVEDSVEAMIDQALHRGAKP